MRPHRWVSVLVCTVASAAKKVTAAQYKGPEDGQIQEDVFTPALQSVEQGKASDEARKAAVEGARKAAK